MPALTHSSSSPGEPERPMPPSTSLPSLIGTPPLIAITPGSASKNANPAMLQRTKYMGPPGNGKFYSGEWGFGDSLKERRRASRRRIAGTDGKRRLRIKGAGKVASVGPLPPPLHETRQERVYVQAGLSFLPGSHRLHAGPFPHQHQSHAVGRLRPDGGRGGIPHR